MCYWWLNNRYKKDRESDSAKLWELMRHTSVYREAWDNQKQHDPMFVDRNPPEIRALKISVGGSRKTVRKVINFKSRKLHWGSPIWRLISEDFDPDKSWLDLSEEQQDIIQQELFNLDPQGKIHASAKPGHFKCRMDLVSLRRKKGKQEEILWSSNHAVVQSKPDPEWFPVFCGKSLEEELYFSVFTFDERLGPTAIERKLKELWSFSYLENTENSTESTKNITNFLNQLRDIYQADMNYSEEVVASRLAVNPKDPYAAELQEDLRKKSLVPWAKRRRQIRNQMLKGQRDLRERLVKQHKKHRLSPIGDWGWKRRIQLIPSVQSPLCQLWFPVGLTEEQVIKMFRRRFREHKVKREDMAGLPLRPSILYSPPPHFKGTTRTQGTDKKGSLGFPWLGLTGRLVKEEEGAISKNSPIVKKLLAKKMAVDPEAINSAKRYVDRFMKQMDDHWRSQIVLR